ncbi:MAG: hypothetical protein EGQ00_10790 [Parabacteroides johnsonii]|nr:hypothetical protein [Parabacteroides johnsonii]
MKFNLLSRFFQMWGMQSSFAVCWSRRIDGHSGFPVLLWVLISLKEYLKGVKIHRGRGKIFKSFEPSAEADGKREGLWYKISFVCLLTDKSLFVCFKYWQK